MKQFLTCVFLIAVTVSYGQTTSWEAIYDVPQGKKGIRGFTKLINKDSNNAELYWRRGYEYYRTNQYRSAILDFTKAIAKDTNFNHSNVLADRGLAKEMLGMYAEAVDDFSNAIAYAFTQDTTIPQGFEKYYFHRGRTKFKMGDKLNAIKDLDSSLIWWTQHYHARKLRAMLLAATGDFQKAMDDYNFLLFKWNGNGEFSIDKEYAIDFYWRGVTKQNLNDSSYLKDFEIASKLNYKKFKPTDLRGL
ncbi:MAG: tetratricopeptide repeat protein [Chitinophagaceae bacterium]|nr:tetratricopeptide repeat protein [Chitinophagaceae bacterium]